jgi:hypothetical protein
MANGPDCGLGGGWMGKMPGFSGNYATSRIKQDDVGVPIIVSM